MERNYDEFDYLTIDVKKQRYEKILKCYNSFGWKQVEVIEHDVYGDTLIVTFERKHKQKNKDKLQLLQVRLENKFSDLSKCEQFEYLKTTSFGTISIVLLLLLLGIGIYMVIKNINEFYLFGGIIFIVISVVLIVLCIMRTIELKKEDEENCKRKIKKINDEISTICDQAKKLVGERTNAEK